MLQKATLRGNNFLKERRMAILISYFESSHRDGRDGMFSFKSLK